MATKILQGRKGIAQYMKMSEKTVDKLIADGLPINRVNGRIYAHIDEIDRYFRYYNVGAPTNPAQYFQRMIYLQEQILDVLQKQCQGK